MKLTGLHHVSAITAQAPRNLDFYTQTLGMRLVKKSVNQDDPSSYHLFYADAQGSPGTDLTFFDIPQTAPNEAGVRSISRIDLRVTGRDALTYWSDRFAEHGVAQDPITTEAGRAVLPFRDFEGQRLALIDDTDSPTAGGRPWDTSPVPAAMQIRGLGAVTLTVRNLEPTARVLTDLLGFERVGSYPAPAGPAREIVVFATAAGGAGAEVHVDERRDLPTERQGHGGVHHVAFRVPDDAEHEAWLARLTQAGFRTSGLVDRFYFHSIYFREPNGILFELATDGPGFAADEDPAHLGETLALPPFLEPYRPQIEANLQPLELAVR
jgi:glyoxalase family protein